MRERDKDEFAILAKLVDIEPDVPGEPVVPDDDDTDFVVDDRLVVGTGWYDYDKERGEYYVERVSGPGWSRRAEHPLA